MAYNHPELEEILSKNSLDNKTLLKNVLRYINKSGVTPEVLGIMFYSGNDIAHPVYESIAQDFKDIIKQNPSVLENFATSTLIPFIYITKDLEFIDIFSYILSSFKYSNDEHAIHLLIRCSKVFYDYDIISDTTNPLLDKLLTFPEIKKAYNSSNTKNFLIGGCIAKPKNNYSSINSFMNNAQVLQTDINMLFLKSVELLDYDCINWMDQKAYKPSDLSYVDMHTAHNAAAGNLNTDNGVIRDFLSFIYKSPNFPQLPLNEDDKFKVTRAFKDLLPAITFDYLLTNDYMQTLSFYFSQKFTPQKEILTCFFDILSSNNQKKFAKEKNTIKVYTTFLDACDKDIALELYNSDKIVVNDKIKCSMIDYLTIKDALDTQIGPDKTFKAKSKI